MIFLPFGENEHGYHFALPLLGDTVPRRAVGMSQEDIALIA